MTDLSPLLHAPGGHTLVYTDPAFPEQPLLLHSCLRVRKNKALRFLAYRLTVHMQRKARFLVRMFKETVMIKRQLIAHCQARVNMKRVLELM